MKRYGNLFDKICDIDNIKLAHKNARKKKTHYKEVKEVASRHKTQEARRTHCDNELLASNI